MTSQLTTRTPSITRHVESQSCCDPIWEEAYRRFETPSQEIAKFHRRLAQFGIPKLARNAQLVDIFCGRGNCLVALEELGFTDLQGVDLSEELLLQYRGHAKLHLADCRVLPFQDQSVDVVIVQGGLHHLPDIDRDLAMVCKEVARVLRRNGLFYIVEPWRTPFLDFAHWTTNQPWVRRIYPRGDALATMTQRESKTYYAWLSKPDEIKKILAQFFEVKIEKSGWGKLLWMGQTR